MGLIPLDIPNDWFPGEDEERREQKRGVYLDSIRLRYANGIFRQRGVTKLVRDDTGEEIDTSKSGVISRFINWFLRRG